jgi:hypothetical protein
VVAMMAGWLFELLDRVLPLPLNPLTRPPFRT